jgi:hypothetical protein
LAVAVGREDLLRRAAVVAGQVFQVQVVIIPAQALLLLVLITVQRGEAEMLLEQLHLVFKAAAQVAEELGLLQRQA